MRRQFSSEFVRQLFEEGRYSDVVKICQRTIAELQASKDGDHETLAPLWDDIATAYFKLNDYPSAIDATKEVMRIDRIAAGETNADHARSLSNLGLMYRRIGRKSEAEMVLRRALEVIYELPHDEQSELATALINLSYVEVDNKNYAAAEKLLLKAAKERLSESDGNSPRFGSVYKHLALLYQSMGKHLAALRTISKAVRILRDSGETNNLDFAMMLTIQGDLFAAHSKFDAAQVSYEEALGTLGRLNPKPLDAIADVQRRLSSVP